MGIEERDISCQGLTVQQLLSDQKRLLSVLLPKLQQLRWYPAPPEDGYELLDTFILQSGMATYLGIFLQGDTKLFIPLRLGRHPVGRDIFLIRFETCDGEVCIEEADEDPGFYMALMAKGQVETAAGKTVVWNQYSDVQLGDAAVGLLDVVSTNKQLVLEGSAGKFVVRSSRGLSVAGKEVQMLKVLRMYGFKEGPETTGTLSYGDEVLMFLSRFIENKGTYWVGSMNTISCMPGDKQTRMMEIGKDLGAVTARMHKALLNESSYAMSQDVLAWKQYSMGLYDEAISKIEDVDGRLAGARNKAEKLFSGMDKLVGTRICLTHQDLHLGQFLMAAGGPMVVDLEGEPIRKGLNNAHLSPARDLATMLRSFDYLFHMRACFLGDGMSERSIGEKMMEARDPWGLSALRSLTNEAFLSGYLKQFGPGMELVWLDPKVLGAFQLEKACYEIIYETTYRPDMAWIPKWGALKLLETHF